MQLKILDYSISKSFGEIFGKPRNLAWPVSAYRVTLPKSSQDGDNLNPFERVILKIIDTGGAWEAETLARETCIPVDLVQFVLLRLRDKAFIDEYNKIIRQKRYNWENEEEKSPVFVTAVLFRELATGKVLPFCHFLDDNNPLKKREGENNFFRIIRYDAHHNKSLPTPRDVIAALRAMKKRSIAFGDETRLPAIQQITIAHDPEQYHLNCPIAIQKSDGEFRIADPFGNGFSLVLENAFCNLLENDNSLSDWMMNWRKRLSSHRQNVHVPTHKEPYDNDSNQGRYQNLVYNLQLRRNTQHRTIEQIHAALEWALFYECAQHPYDTVINQLRLTNQSEHPELLKKATEKLGLSLPQYGFRAVPNGKLDAFLSGKAEMGTVLSIAILMAESDASHPLRRIATKDQDFIIRIFDIKRERDARVHGKGKAQNYEIELPEEDFMRKIVTELLPAMRFSNTPVQEPDRDATTSLLLDARTSIQNEFGFGLFNRLGAYLQDRLIYAERFWISCKDGDDALAFTCDLYAALQTVFTKLMSALPPETQSSELLAKAAENASFAGLGNLPDSLSTVPPDKVQKTLQGDSQTLGACVLAFLLVEDAEILRSIADVQASFIIDVSDIIKWRGHGNEPLTLPKADIGKLRKSTYTIIKTLLET